MPSEYETQRKPSPFQRCAHDCFRENTKRPTLLPLGKFLALITPKCPVALSHLLGFFFFSICKQSPSLCNEYIAKYTGDQTTISITHLVGDVLILPSFFQLDPYLNLSIFLPAPIFKACSIKLTIDLKFSKFLLSCNITKASNAHAFICKQD